MQVQFQSRLMDLQMEQEENIKKKLLKERERFEGENDSLKNEIYKLEEILKEELKKNEKLRENLNDFQIKSPLKSNKRMDEEYWRRLKEIEEQSKRELLTNQALFDDEMKNMRGIIDTLMREKSEEKEEHRIQKEQYGKLKDEKSNLERLFEKISKEKEELIMIKDRLVGTKDSLSKRIEKYEADRKDLCDKIVELGREKI